MEYMKVKIRELHPNPFRDLSSYPFNREKIDRLKKSIEQTGFWDNILARQVNGQVQIAYGHHRLKALQEVFSPDYMVEVPIKDLSDELMLKIMANENMEEWHSSVAVIDETIRATIKFLNLPGKNINTCVSVSNFLNWPITRVENSYSRVNAVNSGEVDKKAIETIPTAKAATAFTAAARKENLTTGQQRRIAKRITEEQNYSPEFVKRAVKEEAHPPTKKEVKTEQKKQIEQFDNYLLDISKRATEFKNELQVLRRAKDAIIDFAHDQFENRIMFLLSLEGLEKTINNTIKYLKDE